MRQLISIAFFLAMLAGAAAEAGVYRVVNVDPGDVLNIRAAPQSSADILGALPPDAAMIEVLEEEDGWARIISGEGYGWVSMAYLEPVMRPVTYGGAPLALQCAGTEPFWGLALNGDESVRFTDPMGDGEAAEGILTESREAQSRPWPFIYYFEGEVSGIAILDRAECSDGMSDIDYVWRAYVDVRDGEHGARFFEGCCRTPVQQ
ncbi:SH3 domain-containing protein [Maricaulis sp.]|uniref:SH3 domain-containing protein n=1 Tax=Maricaulis sp. TaxID=1486257 RepID=UPI0026294AF3|nr:SH3 domain-containing protein [Maricaulis sp.]